MLCRICRKEIDRKDLTATELDDPEKAVYHESFGVACLSHAGIKDHYKALGKAVKEGNEGSKSRG